MHEIGDLPHRIDRAEDVRHMGDADELRAVRDQRFEIGKIEREGVLVQRPELDDDAGIAQPVPRTDIGFVIGDGNDDLVAWAQLAGHGAGKVLQERRGRTAEDNLLRS
jgi:hypothetical protein